jgi:hypothetical protein
LTWAASVSFTALPVSIAPGGTAQLTAHFVAGTGSISPGVGAVTSDVPVAVHPSTTTTYTLAVTYLGSSVSTPVTVTVTAGSNVSVAVSPSSAALQTGALQLFQATVTGSTDTAVAWSVQESGGGSVASDGTYTAPATPGTYHVVATSHADSTKTGSAPATVTSAAPGTTIIYHDALAANWQDKSWCTHNLANTSPVSAGTNSISVDYTPYAALSFYLPTGVTTTGAANLEFDVNGGTTANPAIAAVGQMVLNGTWGPEVNISPYCAGAIPAGAFTHCKVPLSVLQVTSTFQRIALKEVGGLTLPRMYFDEIAVVPGLPSIQSFTASPATIGAGQTATLAATFSNGTGSIDQGVGPIASGATATVSPSATTTYTLTVSDGQGHSVTQTATVTVSNLPVVTITASPANPTNQTTASFSFSSSKTGSTFSCKLDSGAAAACTSPQSYSGLAAGSHTFTVTATDTASNVSAPASSSWTIDLTPPVATITASPANPTTQTTATFSFNSSKTGSTFACKLDLGTAAACTSPQSYSGLAVGSHTFTVTATDKAGNTSAPASLTWVVTPPPISVSIAPKVATIGLSGTFSFTASVSGLVTGQSAAVTWSVQESGGGTVDALGNYIAPATAGTYHVVATSVADITKSDAATVTVGTFTLIPADRLTTWNPGVPGGVPSLTTVCATVNAATYGNGAGDATAAIQAALDGCPVGQVVMLSAGNFSISNTLKITKGIVLRGQGPTQTKLFIPVGTNAALILVGTQWFKFTQSTNLASDAVKGSQSVVLATNPGLSVGEIVMVDQITNTAITEWSTKSPPGDLSRTWFTRPDRPVGQILEVQSVNGNTITFTTPFHISFQTAFTAQLSRFSNIVNGPVIPVVKYGGVEDLYVRGGSGGQGNITLSNAAYSWVKNVESDFQDGPSIAIDASFRCIVRDSYVHTTQQPYPGGGGYGFSFSWYSADNLLENNISWNMNKVMVMRASGGGNVIAYNYMEDGYIGNQTIWVEVGLNASHMTCPHYELFEGNESFNFDGDNTWGNSVYITVFRNHLTGKRRSIAPLALTDQQSPRAIALMEGHKWYSFVGNVLGTANQNPFPSTSYIYDAPFPWADNPVGMWKLGYNPENWNAVPDPNVLTTVLRDGNFDYVTNSVHWTNPAQPLPASLYLSSKPAFFGANPWPWVDPIGATKTATLPARARFDAMPSH